MSELRIARYAPEHRDAVAELQTRLWSADRALNRRYLDWKYHANPFEPAGSPFEAAPCIFLAWQGEVLVGMRGFMPALWQAGPGGAAVLLRCAGDTVVRPGFEGRGLVGRLTSAGLEALRGQGELAVLNTSATEPVFRHSVRSGWQVLGAYVVEQGRAVAAHSAPRVSCVVAERPDPVGMAALVARLPRDGRIRHVRDERYFAWRYGNPIGVYEFILLESASGLAAFCAARVARGAKGPIVSLVDGEAEDGEAQSAISDAFARRYASATVLAWRGLDCAPPSGFRPSLLVKALQPGGEPASLGGRPIAAGASWDFRMIDSDGS